jgi:Tol biopolymer transport system component
MTSRQDTSARAFAVAATMSFLSVVGCSEADSSWSAGGSTRRSGLEATVLGSLRTTRALFAEPRPIRRDPETVVGADMVSADGRFVVFSSRLALVDIDTNERIDVYRLDRQTGALVLVSVNKFGNNGGNADSTQPAISADGRTVAFLSAANDLDPQITETFGSTDLFVRHLDGTPRTLLITTNAAGTSRANGNVVDFSLAADGSKIAFTSTAADITSITDTNGTGDVFVRETVRDARAQLMSRTPAGRAGNGFSRRPRLSGDGSVVVFESQATDLVDGFTDTNSGLDVYRAHFGEPFVGVISRVPFQDRTGNGQSHSPRISADASTIVFLTSASDIVPLAGGGQVVHFDASFGSYALASGAADGSLPDGQASRAELSADGRVVTFLSTAANLVDDVPTPGPVQRLYARHLGASPTTVLLSRSALGQAVDANVVDHVLAANGSMAIFETRAGNLVAGGPANATQLYAVRLDAPAAGATLVSVGRDGSPGDLDSFDPVVSGDGSVVLFHSVATTLAPQLRTRSQAVYLRDLDATTCEMLAPTLLSRTPDGGGIVQTRQAVSADGRFVVFSSIANDLVDNDDNGVEDVFLLDRTTGAITLLSVNAAGTGSANGASRNAAIAGDGSAVVFESMATDLVDGVSDNNRNFDVFRRSLGATPTTTMVSVDATGGLAIGGKQPTINGDGNVVAFVVAGQVSALIASIVDTNGDDDIVVRRVAPITRTQIASLQVNGTTTGNGASTQPILSADGTRIAFTSRATDLVAGVLDTNNGTDVFVRTLTGAGETFLASVNVDGTATGNNRSEEPALSADGRFVAFTSLASDLVAFGGGRSQIYRRDLAGATTLVSATRLGAGGNNDASLPAISADGSFVAFRSRALDLTSDIANPFGDSQVFGRRLDPTPTPVFLISRAARDALSGGGIIGAVAVSGDGSVIAYTSSASDIVANDRNGREDVFMGQLNRGPQALPQAIDVPVGTPQAITLTGADADDDPLTFAVASAPQRGTLSGSGATLTYTPQPGYFGPDAFTFTVGDGELTSSPAEVTLRVVRANLAPAVANLELSTFVDTPIGATLSAFDGDNDPLRFAVVLPPQRGTLDLNPDSGAFVYAPGPGLVGTDGFTVTVSDGIVTSAPATVTIEVRRPNTAPVLERPNEGQVFPARVGLPLTIEVVASDADGDPLSVRVDNGRPGMAVDGTTMVWTPTAGDVGVHTITLVVDDGTDSASRSVIVNVGANNPPRPRRGGCASTDIADATWVLLGLLLLRRRRRR